MFLQCDRDRKDCRKRQDEYREDNTQQSRYNSQTGDGGVQKKKRSEKRKTDARSTTKNKQTTTARVGD